MGLETLQISGSSLKNCVCEAHDFGDNVSFDNITAILREDRRSLVLMMEGFPNIRLQFNHRRPILELLNLILNPELRTTIRFANRVIDELTYLIRNQEE